MGRSRREFLGILATASLLGETRELSREPLISVQDFVQFPSVVTPTPDFFVRNHFAVPKIDKAAYRLLIRSLGNLPRTLALADLEALPAVQLTSVVECAGNGVGMGAVGCTRWEGPLLRELFAPGDRKLSRCFVRLTGADTGSEIDAPGLRYSRTLPLAAALGEHTILALRMNDEPLMPEHGAPVRIVAAGRYGMDSVKWLQSVELIQDPGDSFYMTHRFRRLHDNAPGEFLDFIKVKSVIVSPFQHQQLHTTALTAGGYAWAGPDPVQRVNVRLDHGRWSEAHLLSRPQAFSWVPWQFETGHLRPGVHTIESCAVAQSGEKQPEERPQSRTDAYELNQVQRVFFFSRP